MISPFLEVRTLNLNLYIYMYRILSLPNSESKRSLESQPLTQERRKPTNLFLRWRLVYYLLSFFLLISSPILALILHNRYYCSWLCTADICRVGLIFQTALRVGVLPPQVLLLHLICVESFKFLLIMLIQICLSFVICKACFFLVLNNYCKSLL